MKISLRKLFHNSAPGGPEIGKSVYDEFKTGITEFRVRPERETVREIMERCRKENRQPNRQPVNRQPVNRQPVNGQPDSECVQLAEILEELRPEESCKEWFDRREDNKGEWGTLPTPFKQPLAGFAWEDDWPLEKNARKLSLYRLAAFLDYFRQGEWDWRWPNLDDMQEIEKLGENFASLDEDDRAEFIRHLADMSCNTDDIAIGKKRLKPEDVKILKSNAHLGGKALAEALSDEGFTGLRGRDPLEEYNKKPGTFTKAISRLKEEYL